MRACAAIRIARSGGDAAGAILNRAGASLELIDVSFGGGIASGSVLPGSSAFGGVGGTPGFGATGGGGGIGGNGGIGGFDFDHKM